MHIQPDFEELLRLLEESTAEYLIVGGYAVAFHGYPRLTKDIDVFFDSKIQNAEKIRKVLVQFGFSEQELNIELFATYKIKKGDVIKKGTEFKLSYLGFRAWLRDAPLRAASPETPQPCSADSCCRLVAG